MNVLRESEWKKEWKRGSLSRQLPSSLPTHIKISYASKTGISLCSGPVSYVYFLPIIHSFWSPPITPPFGVEETLTPFQSPPSPQSTNNYTFSCTLFWQSNLDPRFSFCEISVTLFCSVFLEFIIVSFHPVS